MTPRQKLIQGITRRYTKVAREAFLHNTGIVRKHFIDDIALRCWSTENIKIETVADGVLAGLDDDDPMVKYWMDLSGLSWTRFCNAVRREVDDRHFRIEWAFASQFVLNTPMISIIATLAENPGCRLAVMDGVYIGEFDETRGAIVDPRPVKGLKGHYVRELIGRGILDNYARLNPDYDVAAIIRFSLFARAMNSVINDPE